MKNFGLYHGCLENCTKPVISLLAEQKDIDLTYDEGCYFRFTIAHNNIKILNALLDYYKETQLDNCDSNQRMDRKEKLREILQSSVNQILDDNIFDETRSILKPYLDYDIDQDLGELEDESHAFSDGSDESVGLMAEESYSSGHDD